MNLKIPQATKKGYIEVCPYGAFDWAYPNSKLRRGRVQRGGMKILSCAMRGRSEGEWHMSQHRQHLEIGTTISNSITSVMKDCLVIFIYEETQV